MKKERHKIIREFITNNRIDSQETLLHLLTEKGYSLTQATLSRDIKELKIAKVPDGEGKYIYQLSDTLLTSQSASSSISSLGYVNIEFSFNLAVIKTKPGYAMGIAAEIDQKITREIIGSVAGDDTILLIVREGITREEVLAALGTIVKII